MFDARAVEDSLAIGVRDILVVTQTFLELADVIVSEKFFFEHLVK